MVEIEEVAGALGGFGTTTCSHPLASQQIFIVAPAEEEGGEEEARKWSSKRFKCAFNFLRLSFLHHFILFAIFFVLFSWKFINVGHAETF